LDVQKVFVQLKNWASKIRNIQSLNFLFILRQSEYIKTANWYLFSTNKVFLIKNVCSTRILLAFIVYRKLLDFVLYYLLATLLQHQTTSNCIIIFIASIMLIRNMLIRNILHYANILFTVIMNVFCVIFTQYLNVSLIAQHYVMRS